MIAAVQAIACPICGEADDMDSLGETCRVCRMDDVIREPETWAKALLPGLKLALDARMDAHHRDYILTRKLTAELRQAAAPALGDKLSDLSQRIVTAIANGPQTLEQLEAALGCDREALRARLKTLAQGGRVQNISYGNWKLRPRVVFRKGESSQAALATLSEQPMSVADVSRVTRISRANTHRILKRLASLGQALKTETGWVVTNAKGNGRNEQHD